MEAELLISFKEDPSESFVYGVEYGRILERMERGDKTVMNSGIPIRIENKALIERTCRVFGYIATFRETIYPDEWIDFMALKNESTDN